VGFTGRREVEDLAFVGHVEDVVAARLRSSGGCRGREGEEGDCREED
jgi:hypothetical protein